MRSVSETKRCHIEGTNLLSGESKRLQADFGVEIHRGATVVLIFWRMGNECAAIGATVAEVLRTLEPKV